MPIFKYTIPDEVRSRIPDWFYYAFAGEYTAVCGEDVLSSDELGVSRLEYGGGTAGFCEAFRAVCRRFQMDWLIEYYDSLPWYDSDLFDAELASETLRRFRSPTHGATPYYLHLLEEARAAEPPQAT